MWGGESEAVAPIIWLYQIVDAQKEEVFFPDLLIILQSYVFIAFIWYKVYVQSWHNIWSRLQILHIEHRSSICIKSSKGLKIEHCGTPQLIPFIVETTLL